MRVLAFVQAWNSDDPVRGFTVRWMEEIARRVDHLDVIALEQRQPSTAANITVRSLGKEVAPAGRGRARSQAAYLLRWHRHAMEIARGATRPDVVFTHMTPVFTVLAAPYFRPKRIPIVTWFAHRRISRTLRMAHALSTRVVSIDGTSYPYRHDDRFVAVGHGIDTARFSVAPEAGGDGPPLFLSVGRLSPIKGQMTLVSAVDQLRREGLPARAALVGGAPDRAEDRAYADSLTRGIDDLGLRDAVELVGPLPPRDVVPWYHRSTAHVNCAPANNAVDKVALEAMACGVPSLSSAQVLRETAGEHADLLVFPAGDPAALAARLRAVSELPGPARAEMGGYLRRRVEELHGLEQLADRLVSIFSEIRRG